MKCSRASTTRCRNSRTRSGSISVDDVARKSRLACSRLKTSVAGLVLARQTRLGRGAGCSR